MKKVLTIMAVLLLSISTTAFASSNESLINNTDDPVQFFAEFEQGLVSVRSHTIQIGGDGYGDLFNYVTQGGQDVLFPFQRATVGAVINKRHRVSFLYQPLEINTIVPFEDEVMIDGKTFGDNSNNYADATPVELKYGFPFWRVTYSYDVLDRDDMTLGLGAALQIRNASIIFKEVAGSKVSVSQNVGPVPALNIFYMWATPVGINLTVDITGSYASSALINGADFDFEGSLLDASIRGGYRVKHNMEIFANIRFLGGTSKGNSSYDGSNWSVSNGDSDNRYSQNNLATVSATLGVTIR